MARIAFFTFGCKLNFAETSAISRKVAENGHNVIPFREEADFYVFNTCTVTGEAGKKFLRLARHVKKNHPNAKIVALGCFAELETDLLEKIPEADIILGSNEKYLLHDYLARYENRKIQLHSTFREKNFFMDAYSLNDRTRSFLKIQDGCDYFCSYCTIPLARGASRSDSISHLLKSVRTIVTAGVKEIVLTGVNIGDFRSPEGGTFTDLLKELNRFPGLERLTLSSVEPDLLNDEILELISTSKVILPHFHIPLQSGSDKILKIMNRRYDSALFESRILKIRQLMPDAFIGVDVLVGFPGETDEDFGQTFELMEKLETSYLHVFPFSERPDTKAERLPGKVDIRVKSERTMRLLQLSKSKNQSFYQKFTGHQRNVLFERKIKNGFIYGLTDNYLKVKILADPTLANRIVNVGLLKLDEDGVFWGKIV